MDSGQNPVSPDALLAHARWVRHLALRLVSDPSVADDVVQETYAAALENPPSKGVRQVSVRAWLAKVLRNAVRQRARTETRRSDRELDREVGHAGSDEALEPELVDQVDGQRIVVQEVLALDEPYRSTLLLRYFKDLSSAEIARRQGVPAATVRSRLSRGLEELRERMDARYGGDRASWCAVLLAGIGADLAPIPVSPIEWLFGGSSVLKGALVMKVGLVITATVGAAVLTVAGLAALEDDEGQAPAQKEVVAAEAAEAPAETALPVSVPVAEPVEADAGREAVSRAPVSEPEPEPEPIELVAEEGPDPCLLVARFTDTAGNPVPGVRWTAHDSRSDGWELLGQTESDSRGVARLLLSMERETAEHIVAHRVHGFVPGTQSAVARSGEEVHVGAIELTPSVLVRGRVVDEAGQPIEGATVFVREPELPKSPEDQLKRMGPGGHFSPRSAHGLLAEPSAEDGSFEVHGGASTSVRVWANKEGRRFGWTDPLTLEPGQPHFGVEVVLESLQPRDRIAGIALSEDGEPVRNQFINYSFQDEDLSVTSGLITENDGSFELLLVRQVPHNFTLECEDLFPGVAVARDVEPGTHDLVLQLSTEGEIEIAVVDPDGKPIKEFDLETRTIYGGNSMMRSESKATQDGLVEVLIPSDEFAFKISSRGYAERELGPYLAETCPRSITCVLEPVPGVRGRVLANGRPVAGVPVALYLTVQPGTRYERDGLPSRVQGGPVDRGVTDEDGAFILSPPGDGEYIVQAEAPPGSDHSAGEVGPLQVQSTAGLDDLVIELPESGSLVVRVRPEAGRDPAGIIVGITDGCGDRRTQRTDANGMARFDDLRPAQWVVLEAEIELPRGGSSSTMYSNSDYRIPWSCEVREGLTTEYVLDLTTEE